MWNRYIAIFFFFVIYSKAYTNIPHNNNDKMKKMRKNLENNIEIYESIKECNISDIHSCGNECPLCGGKKVLICDYCHGTGFLTMGDVIIGTGNNCTICMGKGEKECKRCMGSGYIAKWRR